MRAVRVETFDLGKRKAGSDYLDATREVDQLIEPRDIVMRQSVREITLHFTPCGNHLILIFRFAVRDGIVGYWEWKEKLPGNGRLPAWRLPRVPSLEPRLPSSEQLFRGIPANLF